MDKAKLYELVEFLAAECKMRPTRASSTTNRAEHVRACAEGFSREDFFILRTFVWPVH